jgi:hypothetical protein
MHARAGRAMHAQMQAATDGERRGCANACIAEERARNLSLRVCVRLRRLQNTPVPTRRAERAAVLHHRAARGPGVRERPSALHLLTRRARRVCARRRKAGRRERARRGHPRAEARRRHCAQGKACQHIRHAWHAQQVAGHALPGTNPGGGMPGRKPGGGTAQVAERVSERAGRAQSMRRARTTGRRHEGGRRHAHRRAHARWHARSTHLRRRGDLRAKQSESKSWSNANALSQSSAQRAMRRVHPPRNARGAMCEFLA